MTLGHFYFRALSLSIPLLMAFTPAEGAPATKSAQATLAADALSEILVRGEPILGVDNGCSTSSKTCDWMASIPDSTPIVHMNIPGTHDTSTWNYTAETQAALERYTGPLPPSDTFQCQEHSIFDSLNDGIRVFDMRYSYNPGNDTIGFYHSSALLAPTTTLEDVLFGFYSWLIKHPTEAVFVSLKYESGPGRPYDEALQAKLYHALFDGPSQRFWVGVENQLGTLGQARGKITLLQRFDWDFLDPTTYPKRMGLHLAPGLWFDNDASIELLYNKQTTPQGIAYIEDFYEPTTTGGTGPGVDAKFAAVSDHLKNATSNTHPDQLFITFASAEVNTDGVFPRLMALGNDTTPGVNQRLLPLLKDLHAAAPQGKARVGMIMLDFYKNVPGLVEAVIGI